VSVFSKNDLTAKKGYPEVSKYDKGDLEKFGLLYNRPPPFKL
jgi:hypothetical protein